MAKVTYYCNTSAVGDTVCAIPTIKALIAEDKLYKVLVANKFVNLLEVCGVDKSFIVESTPETAMEFDGNGSEKICANIPGHAAYRIHLVDLFSIFPINAVLKPEEKCVRAIPELLPLKKIEHFAPFSDPYVVIGVGYVHKSRRLPVKTYSGIVAFCKNKGYNVVLLGASRTPTSKQPVNLEEHPKDGCIDLIDKTTLLESIAIMSKAACVIGVDSGFIYLASVTDAPIVCGYTFVDPHYRMPYREGKKGWKFYPVEPRGECKYCSNDLAMFGVPFDSECPKGHGFSCSSTLHHSDFIREIKKAISRKNSKDGGINSLE